MRFSRIRSQATNAAMCVPDWHGEPLGVLVMLRSQAPRVWGGPDLERIRALADRLSKCMPLTIVLAADDIALGVHYAQTLRAAGHEVWETRDGGEALQLIRTRSPQLLLIENWLPVLNGFEVLERLKGAPEAAGLTAVVLSNDNDADTRLEASALGVADWWRKDLSAVELCARVDQVVRAAKPPV
jgi:two-component system chemotaxis response regulator CheY